eukprot:TRINITY_DN15994_c0_g1_i1.p1 TRINITY_DN15994_c0_g1~~TRINITY_DN15994_c0_g1_i1.p1  ORF type:complete len:193 (-),score=43.83 TRINITY_DN15994_c0_g1_i1:91-669(-)
MQNAFASGKSALMSQALNDTINTRRSYAHTGRAHLVYTQHGFLNGSTCDGHTNYNRHWTARGYTDDCRNEVVGQHGWQLIDSIAAPEPSDVTVRKETYDAFFQTELGAALEQRGVTDVVIGGGGTNVCCDSTARAAFFRGFRVVFLSDGTATSSGVDVQKSTLDNMQLIAADVMSTAALQAELQRELHDDES